MRKIISLFVVLFLVIGVSSTAYSQWELVGDVGYHIWSNSGNTWITNTEGKDDKDFNGLTYQLELTRWWDWIGGYGYVGFDETVHEKMFENRYYTARTRYTGLGLKARKFFTPSFFGYLGGGANFTILKNKLDPKYEETFREFGYDLLFGVNYDVSRSIFLTVNGKYTWCRMWSGKIKATSFNPDGVRCYVGIGYRW